MSGQFRYTEKFLSDWTDFRTYDKENPPFIDYRFGGYLSRRPNHVMKLSIILSAAKGDEMALTGDDIEEAIARIR